MIYRFTTFLALIAIAILASVAQAVGNPDAKPQTKKSFTVVQGKGWSVCESYARFLNSQPVNEPLPSCHLKLSSDLTEPDWEELDIQTHLDVIYSMEHPPVIVSINPDKPPPAFDRWKVDFEQQMREGRSPRLRRTHLALVDSGPVETVMAYEADRNECDETVRKRGYAFWNDGARLWLWDAHQNKIDDYHSGMAFPTAPARLFLSHGKPLMFVTWWGDVLVKPYNKVHVGGRIGVFHVFPAKGSSDPYGNKERCQIGFDLPPAIVERMTK